MSSVVCVVFVCNVLSILWQRSQLDLSFLLKVFPHVRVRFESRDRSFLFLGGRCVELHLNYLSLAVERLVLGGETFPHEVS